jgi:hypothetical protein
MIIKEKSFILNIVLKIILIVITITLNYFLVNDNRMINDSEILSAVIDGADGPTIIYISSKQVLVDILVYSLSLVFIIDIIILLVYDIIGLIKNKIYGIKYKCKIIFTIDFLIIIIISIMIEIIFNLLGPTISIGLSIILIFFIKLYFIKRKSKEKLPDE